MFKQLLTGLLFAASISAANAKTIWQDYSLTYLKGNDYEVGDKSRDVLTFEYVSGTSWGDHFMFFDRLESENGAVETYGEFSPRISITEFDNSFVKAVYFAPSAEFSKFGTNWLYGVGTSLNVPYFHYFQVNAYIRNNDNDDNNEQITLVWGMPVGPLYYDGFMDYATSTDVSAASMNFTSQLKYDVAPHLGLDTKLNVGIEYVFWNNKFGIEGVDERNVNLLVKYHF